MGEKSADERDVDHEVAVLGFSIDHSLLAEREEAEEMRWVGQCRGEQGMVDGKPQHCNLMVNVALVG